MHKFRITNPNYTPKRDYSALRNEIALLFAKFQIGDCGGKGIQWRKRLT